jgi:hypothetical protein
MHCALLEGLFKISIRLWFGYGLCPTVVILKEVPTLRGGD